MPARLAIRREKLKQRISHNFLGLSYESAQLAAPDFFSPENADLAGFLKGIGPGGVLRIGGNTSGYAFWTPHFSPSSSEDEDKATTAAPSDRQTPIVPTQTTDRAIRNLRAFLDKVQWRCIYGLNFTNGTPDQAAEEAAAVSAILGDRLVCVQFGNEVDNLAKKGLRPASYDYSAFSREWANFYKAARARVPDLKAAGPDSALTGAWIREFARQFSREIVLLTTHYYAVGPPTSPQASIGRLLSQVNPRWDDEIPSVQQAMAGSHLPYRLTETNSCYHGGKPGVSNTFASSLWALDLMFQVVLLGGEGINFHGGGYGWYSPIVGTIENGFVARPEYYALLLFSQLLGAQMMANQLEILGASSGTYQDLSCHSLQNTDGKIQAVVINKSSTLGFDLTLQAEVAARRVSVQRLIAPSLESQADVTFSGAPVGLRGAWHSDHIEYVGLSNGAATSFIPASSAALLTWEG